MKVPLAGPRAASSVPRPVLPSSPSSPLSSCLFSFPPRPVFLQSPLFPLLPPLRPEFSLVSHRAYRPSRPSPPLLVIVEASFSFLTHGLLPHLHSTSQNVLPPRRCTSSRGGGRFASTSPPCRRCFHVTVRVFLSDPLTVVETLPGTLRFRACLLLGTNFSGGSFTLRCAMMSCW